MASAKAAPEVIQEWADGDSVFTFERGRMESAVRKLCFEEPVQLHSQKSQPKSNIKLKKEDVDFITKELLIRRPEAERALIAHEGDVGKALTQLMTPPTQV